MRKCLNCNKEITTKQNKFCNRACFNEYQYQRYISQWKNGEVDGGNDNWGGISKHIKRYLRNKYNNACCLCGWNKVSVYTNKVPLEIDHIDGNPMNHSEDNLRLICPNCHSLTENYRGRNKSDDAVLGRGYKTVPGDRTKRNTLRTMHPLIEKPCEYCGMIFKPKNRTQRFCSRNCVQKYKQK